jgi:hypothetical protein
VSQRIQDAISFQELAGKVTFLGFFNLLEKIFAPARSPMIIRDEEPNFVRKSGNVDTRAGPEVVETNESILRLGSEST